MKKDRKKVVVMGGSFNPPTLAHFKLMTGAVDALEADFGLFVPVSDAYLKRKMRKSHPPVVLSPEIRVAMLEAMCSGDSRLHVCEKEIGTIPARTIPTLTALQKENPDAEMYFLMGADKLSLLIHLTANRRLLDDFRVILYSRDGVALEQTLRDNKVFSNYLDRIVILPQPEGIDAISSSIVRERMLSGETSEDLLCPGVWELFKSFTPADFPDVIDSFKGEYAFLSNRFSCRFVWRGLTYRSAEAAFHSSKCTDETERKAYANYSANRAILCGKEQIPYPGWEEERLEIMESILKAKFEQNEDLMSKLAATGNCILINGNKTDAFWGVDLYSWLGENHLGEIIMNIRNKETNR